MRRRWEELEGAEGVLAARFSKAGAPPAGYTGNTVITEWLTINCRGDWASHASGTWVHVLFRDDADRAAAGVRFSDTHG